ncbi:MAG: tetratricopeptide repeat protein [Formivibrio sp.]|nr:tetratricopeptide repeat protein [Formivibrio sp.]
MLIRRILICLPFLISLSAFAGEAEDIQQLLKNRQLPQALERADKFIAANPKDAQVRFLKGIIQTEQGQPAEAIKTFSALAADFPQLPEPYNNLAVLYAQQNQFDKARAALTMAIQTNPSYAIAHENLGDLYAKMASQAYDKALQLENGNANVQTKLTLIRELFSKTPQVAGAKPLAPTSKPVVVVQAPAPKLAPQVKPAAPATPMQTAPAIAPQPVKPVAAVQQAAPSKPVPAPADSQDAEKQKIASAINAWAEAWSHKNVNGYLAAYEHDFRAPGGQKYADWAKERRERITSPKSIAVKLSNIRVDITNDTSAKVRFRQSYRSDRLSSTTSKTMLMQKTAGHWLIHEERTGG